MPWLIGLGLMAILSLAYRKVPEPVADDPEPDCYSDEEREALLMTQLYRSEHLERQQRIRESREIAGRG